MCFGGGGGQSARVAQSGSRMRRSGLEVEQRQGSRQYVAGYKMDSGGWKNDGDAQTVTRPLTDFARPGPMGGRRLSADALNSGLNLSGQRFIGVNTAGGIAGVSRGAKGSDFGRSGNIALVGGSRPDPMGIGAVGRRQEQTRGTRTVNSGGQISNGQISYTTQKQVYADASWTPEMADKALNRTATKDESTARKKTRAARSAVANTKTSSKVRAKKQSGLRISTAGVQVPK